MTRAHLLLSVFLLGCPADPIPPISPLPPIRTTDIGHDVRDADLPDVHYGHTSSSPASVSVPDTGAVGHVSVSSASAPDREWCDGVDNDGDGLVDERVLNRCGECGSVPDDIANAIDDDCDGAIDEGHLDAQCEGDADCLDPLSCQDGRCGMGCPADCELCDDCFDTWRQDEGQPLLLHPRCVEACAICDGFCSGASGVCYQGQCARNADEAACLPGFETEIHDVEWFTEDEGGELGVAIRYVAVCHKQERP